MGRENWNDRACAMWAVEEWLADIDLVVEVLDGPDTAEAASVLRRARDLVIQAISDRSGYRRHIGTTELAELFDVTERTIQDWARKGCIPATKVGGEWVADEWELVDLVFAGIAPKPPQRRAAA